MIGLSPGRVVHYVLSSTDLDEKHQHNVGQHRPATIVAVWSKTNGCSNLVVLVDGTNDGIAGCVLWATSREFSDEMKPGTWHWPEREA